MKKLGYKILTLLIRAIGAMPFWMLYAIADFLYFIIFYVIRYRKKVVLKNLKESFPDVKTKQLKCIEKEFYHNFADYIVETIKAPRMTDEEMRERMQFEGVEMIDEILESGQSIAAYFSHCFNWEWAPSVILWSKLANVNNPMQKDTPGIHAAFCQVYRPLRNEWADREMLNIRNRWMPISIPKARTLRELLTLRKDGVPSITGFMSDQKPSHGDPTYVTMFLNHPTALITGTETLARRLKMAAIYWDMEKVSRGHYKIICRLIAKDVDETEPMTVTAEYAKMLETTIKRDPSIWLWTHKRWKNPVEMPKTV